MERVTKIIEDSSRSPQERDMARILLLAIQFLEKGDFKYANDILKLYINILIK